MSGPARLLRGFATVGGWTMASRILGFVRDIAIAAFLGSGPIAEAFFIAFRLPNMFRRFFAEGAFNVAFVPMFANRLEGNGPDDARDFARRALSMLFACLIALTVIAQLAMPWFVLALASGQRGGGTFDLAVEMSRITFPYILLISLAAVFSGILNAFGRFSAAAAAPVLLNVVLIATILGAWQAGVDLGQALTWGVLVAGLAQLALVWGAARRLGMGVLPGLPRLTPDVRRLIIVGVPAALAGGITQINLVVGTQIASYFDGAIGWLWYADRVYQLPMGVIGIAVGVVLLPELARQFRRGDTGATRAALNRATEFSMLLTLPAAAALIAIPGPVVALLFERGAFTAADTAATAAALAVYAVGLPSFVLQKILAPAFFAREDTRSPVRYAVVSMVVNLVVAVGLMPVLGFLSVAVAASLAGWANVWLLWRGARRMDPDLGIDAPLRRRLGRMTLAATLMGAAGAAMITALQSLPAGWLTMGTAAVIGACIVVYFASAILLGACNVQDLRLALRRRPAS